MRSRWLALILLLFSMRAYAQDAAPPANNSSGNAILRGTVTATGGGPLAYAVVTIQELGRQQFSNAQGKFYFVNMRPGAYRVTVRQLGYSAVTLNVTLSADKAEEVAVSMNRIVTQLAAVRVAAGWACEKPGRPAGVSTGQLVEVFEQLEQNAVRLRLLSMEYPFETITERKRMLKYGDGLETLDRVDSIRSVSATTARYEPGKVVYEVRAEGKPREKRLQVPTLLDFADSLFQANHCFTLAGIEENEGVREIRVEFKPWAKLKTPDVGGSVFLQPDSYKLLRSEIELTRVPNDVQGLERLHATTYFDDIVPGLPSVAEIIATSDLKSPSLVGPRRAVERIVTLKVVFKDKRPGADSSAISSPFQ